MYFLIKKKGNIFKVCIPSHPHSTWTAALKETSAPATVSSASPAVQHSEQRAHGSPWVKAKPASLTLASSSLPRSLAARLIFSSWGANFQHAEGNAEFLCSAEGNTEFPCSAVPMFENRPCLRIHIFPPLVSASTNRGVFLFLFHWHKIWYCAEGLTWAAWVLPMTNQHTQTHSCAKASAGGWDLPSLTSQKGFSSSVPHSVNCGQPGLCIFSEANR